VDLLEKKGVDFFGGAKEFVINRSGKTYDFGRMEKPEYEYL